MTTAAAVVSCGAATRFGGWYDLRLRLSEAGPIVRLPEPVYSVPTQAEEEGEGGHFSYVDHRNRQYQVEVE